MLADITDHLYSWQLIPILLMAAAWVAGGGFLLKKCAVKAGAAKLRFGHSCITMFFAALASILAVSVIALAAKKLGEAFDVNLFTTGIIGGGLLAIGFFFLVIYSMLDLPFKKSLRAALPTFVVMVVLMGVMGAIVIPISTAQTRQRRGVENCQTITAHLAEYFCLFSRPADFPANLHQLDNANGIKFKLRCPARPNIDSYFYLRPRDIPAKDQVILCDLADNHNGIGRSVIIMKDGLWRSQWVTELEFQELMQLPVNAPFYKALLAQQNK